MLFLRTPHVEPFSVAPKTTKDAGRLGVALALGKSVVTGLTSLQNEAMAEVSDGDGERKKMLVTVEDIDQKWRAIPIVDKCIRLCVK